jgi:hypothetical protein
MRLCALLFTAILTAPAAAWAQSSAGEPPQDTSSKLPVSLDKIREGLEATPIISLRTIDERPTFRVMVRERQKLEELIASINFKSSSPAPGGGLYGYEMQRQMFPAVDNPLRQPYAAFSQPELLTILVENLARVYLADKVTHAITNFERERAQAAAKEEVRQAVAEYCGAQPNAGAGILICTTPIR